MQGQCPGGHRLVLCTRLKGSYFVMVMDHLAKPKGPFPVLLVSELCLICVSFTQEPKNHDEYALLQNPCSCQERGRGSYVWKGVSSTFLLVARDGRPPHLSLGMQTRPRTQNAGWELEESTMGCFSREMPRVCLVCKFPISISTYAGAQGSKWLLHIDLCVLWLCYSHLFVLTYFCRSFGVFYIDNHFIRE